MLYVKGQKDGRKRRVEHIPADFHTKQTIKRGPDGTSYARVFIYHPDGTRQTAFVDASRIGRETQ